MNFKQFQDTRKLIDNPKHSDSYKEDNIKQAYTYLDTFTAKCVDVVEALHIEVATLDAEKYYMIIERTGYGSDNLEELEKLLYNYCLEEGYIEVQAICKACNGSESDIDDERAPCRYCIEVQA